MIVAAAALPLFGFLLTVLLARFMGTRGANILLPAMMLASSLLMWYFFVFYVRDAGVVEFKIHTWFDLAGTDVSWVLFADGLTAVMLIVISTVSWFVHLYSTSYMLGDPHHVRFMGYLSLFTFFMYMLVMAGNFIQLFFGWEGVGLTSYLLISFWNTRVQAAKAALKAMVVNRIGDAALLIALGLIFYFFGTFDFTVLFCLVSSFDTNCSIALSVIGLLLLAGAAGKSAQLGLHTWLPDAMEGPTPVSALIHAATMVTAGIFLIVRSSLIFEFAGFILPVVSILGGLTAIFAASVALFQNDLKKVIAYSTCSQLGYMAFVCGLSAYSVGMFHLFTHAFFKALLFLTAGGIIHSIADEQDTRRMGGLTRLLPFTCVCLLTGNFALIGVPFLAGFFSKDLILEEAFSRYSIYGSFLYFVGLFSAVLTAAYSFRSFYLVFFNVTRAYKSTVSRVVEVDFALIITFLGLGFGSVTAGYLFFDVFVGAGSDFWGNSIMYFAPHGLGFDAVFLTFGSWYQILPTALVCFGVGGGLSIYYSLFFTNFKGAYVYAPGLFFSKKWFFDQIYNVYLTRTFLNFGYKVAYILLDKGLIEVGLRKIAMERLLQFSYSVRSLQTGYVFSYYAIMGLGLMLLLVLLANFGYILFLLFLITVLMQV